MSNKEEQAWLRGNRVAWAKIAKEASRNLAPQTEDVAYLKAERAFTVDALRELCAVHGDNDWDENLYLPDVIENHLTRHLAGQRRVSRKHRS